MCTVRLQDTEDFLKVYDLCFRKSTSFLFHLPHTLPTHQAPPPHTHPNESVRRKARKRISTRTPHSPQLTTDQTALEGNIYQGPLE